MGCKVLWLNVALLAYLMICEHVRAQCTQPSFPSSNAIVSDSHLLAQSFPDGSTVTFECEIGYKPENSRASKSVKCERNQWTSLELNCIKKSCGSPPEFDNGRYDKEGILFGDKITAVCNPGYMLDGRIKHRWCRDQGWDGRDPVCEVVKCTAPPPIVNGQLEEEPLDSYEYSQVVTYKCNGGLSLIGSPTLHCSENGTFQPDPPKCMDGCPKPEIPHAIRIGGKSAPYKLNNFIDYRCEDPYTMKGEYHIVCKENGWNPEPPKCIGPCSRPDLGGNVILTEEFRTQNSFPDQSKVTFECDRGYEPVDSTVSKSVTCEENHWTKLLLTCKATTTTTSTIVTTTTSTTVMCQTRPDNNERSEDTSPSSTTVALSVVGVLAVLGLIKGFH
ncbi:hypothetical protein R3I94_017239 [Phoxinus phoxinus]